MTLAIPTGPLAHVGIVLPVAYVLRLNLGVTALCALLPDMVDKPLWALGVGAPRYIAHTLLFVVAVSFAFFLWRRAFGLAALLGGTTHLLLDLNSQVPWFYPFASYDFPEPEFDPSSFFQNLVGALEYSFAPSRVGNEVMWVVIAVVAAFLFLRVYRHFSKRLKQTE